MKVTVKSLTDEEMARGDYRDMLQIDIDSKRVFFVIEGEPEDATLSRDFNDCHKVPDLMRLAHKAGVDGEPFEIETIKVDEI